MSARGLNFLHKWIDDQLPEHSSNDPGLATALADRMMRDASKAGFPSWELQEEVESVFAVVLAAMAHKEGGPAD